MVKFMYVCLLTIKKKPTLSHHGDNAISLSTTTKTTRYIWEDFRMPSTLGYQMGTYDRSKFSELGRQFSATSHFRMKDGKKPSPKMGYFLSQRYGLYHTASSFADTRHMYMQLFCYLFTFFSIVLLTLVCMYIS